MRWYGGEGGEDFSAHLGLGGGEVLVADLVIDLLEECTLFETAADGETIVKLVAGELDLPAVIVVLEEPDEMAGREVRIVEDLERALDGEMAGLFLEAVDFEGIERGGGRGRGLVAAPLEDVGAVEAPNGHAGGFDAVALAEIGAHLPAIADAGRRVVEPAVGVFGVLEAVIERFDARDF
jgi:hypothetical protein